MDVVYILGTGSEANDIEIRYSLRSLEKNMLDLGKVFIVGVCPSFLKNIIHIPILDSYPKKWQNAYLKISTACFDARVSDDFLLMNDDFFILEPFEGALFPFYSLKKADGGPDGPHSFHIHCPIRYNKEMFLKMPLSTESSGAHSLRTFYSNFYRCPRYPTQDFILPGPFAGKTYNDQVDGWPSFTIGTQLAKRPDFIEWLDSLYPEPSRFENS